MTPYRWGVFVRVIIILGLIGFGIWGITKVFPRPAAEKAPVVPTQSVVPPVIPTAEPEVQAPPVVEAEEPAKVPDTVEHFYDLATFYIDGDPKVEGFKVQGVEMKYTCEQDFGVYITMDPGVVNGNSTGDLGAVFYVSCEKGDVVTLTTPHWSTSALHQQIHLIEFTQEITAEQALTFLKVLKVDEGKEVAFFIDKTGKVTKY